MFKKDKNKFVWKVFFASVILCGIVEYFSSLFMELAFNTRWWDYTGEPFNFQGRISLAFSIAWGIIGVIFVDKIHPFIKRKLERYTIRFPHKVQVVVLNIFLVIILIDFVMSIIKYSPVMYL